MTRMLAAAAMDPEVVRGQFRPSRIGTLFVGESAPHSGEFFYVGNTNLLQEHEARPRLRRHERRRESKIYVEVGKEYAGHKTVEHGWNQRGYYVGKDGQTTNAVENFFGNFKRSMKGTYRFCSEQHLQRYLCEFEFRHNNRSGIGNYRWGTDGKCSQGCRGQAPDVPAD